MGRAGRISNQSSDLRSNKSLLDCAREGLEKMLAGRSDLKVAEQRKAVEVLALLSQEEENEILLRYRQLLAAQILEENPALQEFFSSSEWPLPEGDPRRFLEQEAARQGLHWRFLDQDPGGFRAGSVQLGDDILILSASRSLATSKGLGGNFLQAMTSAQITLACRDMAVANRSIFIQNEDDDALAFGDLEKEVSRLEEQIEAGQIEDNNLKQAVVFLRNGIEKLRDLDHDRFYEHIASAVNSPRIEQRAKARMSYHLLLSKYARMLDILAITERNLEATIPDADPRTASEYYSMKDSMAEARRAINIFLEEPLRQAEEIVSKYGVQVENKSELLLAAAWNDAIDGLENMQSANSAAAWAHIAHIIGSEDIDEWRHITSLRTLFIPLAYGVQVIEADPALQAVAEQVMEEEDDLRLRARVLGKIPTTEIIYLPSTYWQGGEEDRSLIGNHAPAFPNRPSFVFLANIEAENADDTLEESRHSAIHELVHATQPFDPAVSRQEEFVSLQEAITETLARIRSNEQFAQNPVSANLRKKNTSYYRFVSALVRIMDDAGVPPSDRELLLEHLSAMSHEERLREIGRMLGRDGLAGWLEAISEK